MKGIFFSILVLVCSPLSLATTQADKLQQQLISAESINKSAILFELLDHFRNSKPKVALDYGKQALVLLRQFPDNRTKVAVFNEMSWAWRLLSQYEKALLSAKEGEKLAILIDDQHGLGRAVNNIGVIYWSLGDYKQVLDYWLHALAIREAINDDNGVAGSLNNIGQVYFHLGNNEGAIRYFEQALAISTKTGNREYLVNHLDNLGEVYLTQKLFSKAEFVLLQAKKMAVEDGNNKGHISTLINLGQLNILKNNFFESEKLFIQANILAQQTGFIEKVIESQQKLALISYKKLEYGQALVLAQKALAEAEKQTNKKLLMDLHLLIANIQEGQKQYQHSLKAFKDYKNVSDRLLSQTKQNQITSLQMQFETEQQEKKIKQLSTENSLREYELKAIEKSKTSLQVGVTILTVFTVILIWGYRAKSKVNKVISQQYKQLEQSKQQLHQMAITDPLTQLFNRRAINERLENELVRAKLKKSSLCLCFMDLDNFKLVNDNYGHDFGDYVLTEIADILQLEMRKEDVVGRWGGEEFFILLTDSNLVSAESILQRVLGVISKYPFTLNGITLQITATIGFSIYQASITPLNDVMKAADDALYEGKKLGRNQVIVRDIR